METKTCNKCGVEKDVREFHSNGVGKPRRPDCKSCSSKRARAYREANAEKIRKYQRQYHKGYYQANKKKINDKNRDYYYADGERSRAYRAKYYQDNKVRLKRHGLSQEQCDEILERQGGACASCGTTDPGYRDWDIDHDHQHCPGRNSCGECVRGFLCGQCNRGIGHLRDSYQRTFAATLYLIDYEISKYTKGVA